MNKMFDDKDILMVKVLSGELLIGDIDKRFRKENETHGAAKRRRTEILNLIHKHPREAESTGLFSPKNHNTDRKGLKIGHKRLRAFHKLSEPLKDLAIHVLANDPAGSEIMESVFA